MTEVGEAAVDDVLAQLRRLEAQGDSRAGGRRRAARRAPGSPRPRGRRRVAWVVALAVLLLAAWFAAAGWTLWRARGEAVAATDRLEQLRAGTDLARPDTARLAA